MAGLLRQDFPAGKGVALHRVLVHRHQGVVERHIDMLANASIIVYTARDTSTWPTRPITALIRTPCFAT